MTYRDLIKALLELNESQLNCDVTVELGPEDECYPAELRVCGPEHFALEDCHPVIFVP